MKPNPLDIFAAHLLRGDKCGHAALAAILDVSMSEARRLMPPKENKLVNAPMLQAALTRAGRKWRDIGTGRPAIGRCGLVLLCFNDANAHWIAVYNAGESIRAFDNNAACWMSLGLWESFFLPMLKAKALSRKCWIETVIEVEPC